MSDIGEFRKSEPGIELGPLRLRAVNPTTKHGYEPFHFNIVNHLCRIAKRRIDGGGQGQLLDRLPSFRRRLAPPPVPPDMRLLELDKLTTNHHHHHAHHGHHVIGNSVSTPLASDDENNAGYSDSNAGDDDIDFDETEPFLKLNIGGCSFRIRANTVYHRLRSSRLAKFLLLTRELRGGQCDGFLPDTEEYYFERSAKLFESIYKFYATGALHRPLDVCHFEFHTELDYWQIEWEQIAPCCQRLATSGRSTRRKSEKEEQKEPDPFDKVKHGALRRQIWNFCEGSGTFWSNIFSFVSIAFVLLSVCGLILGSIPELQVPIVKNATLGKDEPFNETIHVKLLWEPHPAFGYLETICIMWFTVEYLLRFTVSPIKCKFVCGLMNLVDMIAIVPFFLELGLTLCGIDIANLSDIKGALLVVRVLRVLRVVRILKLGRYSSGMRTFALTLKSSARQLGMMGMVLSTGIVFFSTLVYFIEKDEVGTPFHSIPAAFWWCIVTMTTVGYGDVVPSTIPGKLIASGAIISGVLVLALPITIIVDNFMKVSGNPGFGQPRPEKKPGDEETITLLSAQSSSP
uniref:BTB domain-containing protein n=1 Tax=Plectus sambesii TaxID=2011161 RepID=A0A914XEG1_9BILA